MKKLLRRGGILILVLAGAVVAESWVSGKAGEGTAVFPELRVVEHVDLERYLGTWYSVASIPQVFTRGCFDRTTATYTLRPDGDIGVRNSCLRKDGSLYEVNGRAWVVDAKTNAKLKVSFLPGLKINALAGDYWIIELGPNYEYAVVGHPGRTFGWILSRTPSLPDEVLKGIRERLAEQGYDPKKFVPVRQSGK